MEDFIAKLVSDPSKPPDTILLTGYLGASSEEGHTRLYFDAQLASYIELPDDAILHRQEIPREQSPLGGSYVWIRRDAELIHGKVDGPRPKARFFEGQIAQTYAPGAVADQPMAGGQGQAAYAIQSNVAPCGGVISQAVACGSRVVCPSRFCISQPYEACPSVPLSGCRSLTQICTIPCSRPIFCGGLPEVTVQVSEGYCPTPWDPGALQTPVVQTPVVQPGLGYMEQPMAAYEARMGYMNQPMAGRQLYPGTMPQICNVASVPDVNCPMIRTVAEPFCASQPVICQTAIRSICGPICQSLPLCVTRTPSVCLPVCPSPIMPLCSQICPTRIPVICSQACPVDGPATFGGCPPPWDPATPQQTVTQPGMGYMNQAMAEAMQPQMAMPQYQVRSLPYSYCPQPSAYVQLCQSANLWRCGSQIDACPSRWGCW